MNKLKTLFYPSGLSTFTCTCAQHNAVHLENGVVKELKSQITKLGPVEKISQLAEKQGLPVADFDWKRNGN